MQNKALEKLKKTNSSIIQENESECYFVNHKCKADPDHPIHTYQELHKHHIFGRANRKISDKYGLWVKVCCIRCHVTGPTSIHENPNDGKDLFLKQAAQKEVEKQLRAGYEPEEAEAGARKDFISIFGKSYL